ncbi:hypothetical protein J2S70_001728 [Trueperella bonasi]|uniref:Uncharacterized protein n=1 Tax=Trueperella bonasi TaxID=312286 RepID=A0ABT9NIB6_9ACTO|nr:hypothetical protein [Trueperella bonasi]MDP9807146.1 hypothetical protein [Trueperella bonasi]
MRVTTSALGTIGIIIAIAGIIRATGTHVDVRVLIVISLLTLSLLLAASAFAPPLRRSEGRDEGEQHHEYKEVRV